MAFDETVAERLRLEMADQDGLTEKHMFGGLAFLVNGNMCCGVSKHDVILRLSDDDAEDALDQPGFRVFDLTGRPMSGWVLMTPDGHADDSRLSEWVARSRDFAASLPPKSGQKARKMGARSRSASG